MYKVKRVFYCIEIRMYTRRIKIRLLKCNSREQKEIHYIKDKVTRTVKINGLAMRKLYKSNYISQLQQ